MIVNLREGAVPIVFGDAASRDKYLAEREAMRDAMTSRYAVAPRVFIESPRGKLGPGMPVEPRDFHIDEFRKLVQRGFIIESNHSEPPPAA